MNNEPTDKPDRSSHFCWGPGDIQITYDPRLPMSKNNMPAPTRTDANLPRPSGFIEAERVITPIWMEKDGKRVSAEIHEGPYVGMDGVIRLDNGSVYNLKSDECFSVFGECHPFGTESGERVSYYLKNGAVIRVRQ